jgi:hypothetical protein
MDRTYNSNGDKRNSYTLLVGNSEGKRPLGKPRCRWVNNINMDFGETGWGGVDWIGLAYDRDNSRVLVKAVTNLRVPCWEVEWMHNRRPLE